MSNESNDWYCDDLKERAYKYAFEHHKGQKRKFSDKDYIIHPLAVAKMVDEYMRKSYKGVPVFGFDPRIVAQMWVAGVLHDTVEDTDATLEDIEEKFGKEVAYMVDGLTDISKPEDGNRKTRKAMDLEHNLSYGLRTLCIKICDVIHNLDGMVKAERENSKGNFSYVFLKEKEAFYQEAKKRFIDTKNDDQELYIYKVFLALMDKLRIVLDNEWKELNHGRQSN